MIPEIKRDKDIIFKNKDLEHLYTFKNFPVYMGCTEQNHEKDLFSDMSYWISEGSGVIQLNPLLPLEVVYPDSHGSGVVGSSWKDHHNDLSEFILEFKPKSVLEIGGGHGMLATNCLKHEDIKWTIIEPNPSLKETKKIKIIKGFFEENLSLDFKVDTIVHSHLIEHIYNPDKFIKDLYNFLDFNQYVIFSIPNMEKMLEKKFTNCLNFEHTIYLNSEYIKFLFSLNNFELVKEKKFREDHSIFYCFKKVNKINKFNLSEDIYSKNKKLYISYIQHHKKWALSINKKIRDYKNDVFLFGAHAQSQFMLNFGIDPNLINKILDNDAGKQNKRLYGTKLFVSNPNIIENCIDPIVILRAGTFQNEISEQLIGLNPNVIILD